MSFIYLASPYSHHKPEIQHRRFLRTQLFTASALQHRELIYSPIVHCHELAKKYSLPKDFEFWQKYNFAMLCKAKELWVLTLDGWKQSVGVAAEMDFAELCSIPIIAVDEKLFQLREEMEGERDATV